MRFRVVAFAALVVVLVTAPSVAQIQQNPFDMRLGGRPTIGDDGRSSGTSLTGSVRDADNRGVGNIRVDVRNLSNGSIVASAYTNVSGVFEIADLRRGVYELVATSGVSEARERVDLTLADFSVTLHLPTAPQGANGQTVSVAQMKVPDKARNQVRKAQEDLSKHKIAEARHELKKALEIYPEYAEADSLLGIIDLGGGDTATAIAELEKAVELDPNAAMAFTALGAAYNGAGRFDDALRALDSAGRLQPNSWQVYFESAKANLSKADFASALRQIGRAEELCPSNYPMIYMVKAHALLGLRNYPAAAAELEKFLNREPQGPGAIEARQTLEQVKAFTK